MAYDIISCDNFDKIYINDEFVGDYDSSLDLVHWIENDFSKLLDCPYCGTKLSYGRDYSDKPQASFDNSYGEVNISECIDCGYWHAHIYEELGTENRSAEIIRWQTYISKLHEFPNQLPDGCSRELAQYLKIHPEFWHQIDPTRLEKLVADIFKANYRHSNVLHVGKPNDGGVDVVFIDSGEQKWLIQVKRRESERKTEGVSTLRNLLGVMVLEGSKFGAIVSTADHFSYWANKSKKNAESKGYMIEMIDKGRLKELINPLLPVGQWNQIIKDLKPELVNSLTRKIEIHSRNQISIFDFINK